MGAELEERINEVVLFRRTYTKVSQVPVNLRYGAFVDCMDRYGAKLLFNYWRAGDDESGRRADTEQQVWFKPEKQLVIVYFSRQSPGDSSYLFVTASSSADTAPDVRKLRKLLGLKKH